MLKWASFRNFLRKISKRVIKEKKWISLLIGIISLVSAILTLSNAFVITLRHSEITDAKITAGTRDPVNFTWLYFSPIERSNFTFKPRYYLIVRESLEFENPIFPFGQLCTYILPQNVTSVQIVYKRNCEIASLTDSSITVRATTSRLYAETCKLDIIYWISLDKINVAEEQVIFKETNSSISVLINIYNNEPYKIDSYWCLVNIPLNILKEYRVYSCTIETHGKVFTPLFGIKAIYRAGSIPLENITIPFSLSLDPQKVTHVKMRIEMNETGTIVIWGPEGPLLQPGAIRSVIYDNATARVVWKFYRITPPWFNVSLIDMKILDSNMIELSFAPKSVTKPYKKYTVSLYIDGCKIASQNISWTNEDIKNGISKQVLFKDVDLVDCYVIAIDVTENNCTENDAQDFLKAMFALRLYIEWLKEKAPNCGETCLRYIPLMLENGTDIERFILFLKGWVLYKCMSGLWPPLYEITPKFTIIISKAFGLPATEVIVQFSDGEIHTDIAVLLPDFEIENLKKYTNVYGPPPILPNNLFSFYNAESAAKDKIKYIAFNIGGELIFLYKES
jgi:hypothetical protein